MSYKEKLNSNYFSSKSVVDAYSLKRGLTYPEKELFEMLIDKTMNVLDIGCGTGRTTVYLHGISKKVIGIDLSEEMIESSKSKFAGIEFKTMDAIDLHFADATFDAVVFSYNGIDCLYPEEKRDKVYKEVNRTLKSGGVFIYSSHVIPSLFAGPFEFFNFLLNVITLKVFGWFRFEVHKKGLVFLYYGNEKKEIHSLDRAGFTAIKVIPNREKNPLWNYYACKKR
jgi:ubiquinone/menaquinone biosynthesis C-methylase UbiE